MAKKCGNCGAPAPDSNSRFCDLCGAPFREEPATPQGLPVCPSCGAVVSDIKAQFCDACGAPLAKPVCPACGNTAPSYHSKFCTRCGASFVPATSVRGRTVPVIPPAQQAVTEPEPELPVKVTLRKGRLPVAEDPSDEWDPWTDGDPTYDVSAPLPLPQPQQQYTDLKRVGGEMAQPERHAPAPQLEMVQIAEPRKKYSHLPLIADELQADIDRRAAEMPETVETSGLSGQAKRGKKKGMFSFK
ncbi:MAG: zinc ribbon domain-containing protein [Methanoregula sp.]|nr:zinc ribbon domain-containing protein [Methanoregula sp.]